jgi:hypothetical protein
LRASAGGGGVVEVQNDDSEGAAMRTGGGAVALGRQTAAVRLRGRWRGRRTAADGGAHGRHRGGAVAELTAKARRRQKLKTSGRQRAGKRVIRQVDPADFLIAG